MRIIMRIMMHQPDFVSEEARCERGNNWKGGYTHPLSGE